MIEFACFAKAGGSVIPSQDDLDILLVHTIELINYASYSDSINDELENPQIDVLASGRLGISHEEERKGIGQFREEMYGEEMNSYAEEFTSYFIKEKEEKQRTKEQQAFREKITKVFEKEWGINLSEMDAVAYTICARLITEKLSVKKMRKAEFVDWVVSIADFTKEKAEIFLDRMIFLDRPAPLKPPAGYEGWEVYPWRFNRRLSYLHRPIVAYNENGEDYLLISARHLLTSAENYTALFFNGALKVDSTNKGIIQLMAEINKIKGKEYRDKILNWLKQNTSLEVMDYEVKIRVKGFFRSEQDKGDIDILAVDRTNNIIYSLECKNTIQSKVAHEYKMEINNYLGTDTNEGLIAKHVNRHKWLVENNEQVNEKLKMPKDARIVSLVISNNILPLKHLKPVPIPVISFF